MAGTSTLQQEEPQPPALIATNSSSEAFIAGNSGSQSNNYSADTGSNTSSNNYDSNQQSNWLGHAAHPGQAIAPAIQRLLSLAIKRCPGPNVLEWFTRALIGAWLQTILMVVVAVSICFEAIYSTKYSCNGQ